MPRITKERVMEIAFGPKGTKINDDKLLDGLALYSSYLLATKLISAEDDGEIEPYLNSNVNLLRDDYHNMIGYLTENYDFSGLDKLKDFPYHSDFYDNNIYEINNLNNSTDNEDALRQSLATGMMEIYYKSGAALRDNEADNSYIMFFTTLPEDNVKYFPFMESLLKEQEKLNAEYCKKSDYVKLYQNYVLGADTEGLNEAVFQDKLTADEKKNALKKLSVDNVLLNYKKNFNSILNIQDVSEDDRIFSRDYYMDHDGGANRVDYRLFRIRKAMSPDMLDKENVKNLIDLAKNIRAIHNSRSAWTRFWGYYGKVGKENTAIEEIKNYLVSKKLSREDVEGAIEGKKDSFDKLMNVLPEKEDRINNQKVVYANYFKKIMRLTDADIETVERYACRTFGDEMNVKGANLEPDDIAMFRRPDTMFEFGPKKVNNFEPCFTEEEKEEIENSTEADIISDDFAKLSKNKFVVNNLVIDENEEIDTKDFLSDDEPEEIKPIEKVNS